MTAADAHAEIISFVARRREAAAVERDRDCSAWLSALSAPTDVSRLARAAERWRGSCGDNRVENRVSAFHERGVLVRLDFAKREHSELRHPRLPLAQTIERRFGDHVAGLDVFDRVYADCQNLAQGACDARDLPQPRAKLGKLFALAHRLLHQLSHRLGKSRLHRAPPIQQRPASHESSAAADLREPAP